MTNTPNPREAALEAVAAAAREATRAYPLDTMERERLLRALADLDALPAPDGGWRPIADAPKDGTRIRILSEGEVEWREPCPAVLVSGGWHRVSEKDKVLGWQPLPPPPVPQSAED